MARFRQSRDDVVLGVSISYRFDTKDGIVQYSVDSNFQRIGYKIVKKSWERTLTGIPNLDS